MEIMKWTKEEVISYLEQKVLDGSADESEIELYEGFVWNGKLDRKNNLYTYKKLISQMKMIHEGR